jgi:hypothetical protein
VSVVADRACRGLCVQLVCVVEDSGLGGARSLPVVVCRHGVQELREDGRVEVACALLDHPKAEVDVSQEPPFLGLAECRAAAELAYAPDVVEERGREEQVVSQALVQLGRFAAERGDSDGVLEEAACIAVVPVCSGGRE